MRIRLEYSTNTIIRSLYQSWIVRCDISRLDKVIIRYVALQSCTASMLYYILCTLLAKIDMISLFDIKLTVLNYLSITY